MNATKTTTIKTPTTEQLIMTVEFELLVPLSGILSTIFIVKFILKGG